jgi:hypothetical protein
VQLAELVNMVALASEKGLIKWKRGEGDIHEGQFHDYDFCIKHGEPNEYYLTISLRDSGLRETVDANSLNGNFPQRDVDQISHDLKRILSCAEKGSSHSSLLYQLHADLKHALGK